MRATLKDYLLIWQHTMLANATPECRAHTQPASPGLSGWFILFFLFLFGAAAVFFIIAVGATSGGKHEWLAGIDLLKKAGVLLAIVGAFPFLLACYYWRLLRSSVTLFTGPQWAKLVPRVRRRTYELICGSWLVLLAWAALLAQLATGQFWLGAGLLAIFSFTPALWGVLSVIVLFQTQSHPVSAALLTGYAVLLYLPPWCWHAHRKLRRELFVTSTRQESKAKSIIEPPTSAPANTLYAKALARDCAQRDSRNLVAHCLGQDIYLEKTWRGLQEGLAFWFVKPTRGIFI